MSEKKNRTNTYVKVTATWSVLPDDSWVNCPPKNSHHLSMRAQITHIVLTENSNAVVVFGNSEKNEATPLPKLWLTVPPKNSVRL